MKSLNFIINQFKKISARKNVLCLIWKVLIIYLFVFVFVQKSVGQTVVEYNAMLAQMTGSSDSALVSEAVKIRSLVSELHPTVYVGDVIRVNGEASPVRADVKTASVSKLSVENPLFAQVELITLRINSQADLSTLLDLSSIQGFSNLKYVRLLCSFECSAEQLSPIVTGNSTGIKVFYSISIPS